jgi:hypothetical protein
VTVGVGLIGYHGGILPLRTSPQIFLSFLSDQGERNFGNLKHMQKFNLLFLNTPAHRVYITLTDQHHKMYYYKITPTTAGCIPKSTPKYIKGNAQHQGSTHPKHYL